MSSSNHGIELSFRESVSKIPSQRSSQDLTIINAYLKHLESLSTLRESHIRNLCKTIRLETHDTHHILFRRHELNTCWYILLSGSVFIESTMYLPRASFGKRTPTNQYRMNECVLLEPSELLVVDYPIEKKDSLMQIENQLEEFQRKKSSRTRKCSLTLNESTEISSPMILSSHSRASDTSSAYSGSDIMQSSTNGDEPIMMNNDTDEESEDSDDSSFPIRDHVRDALMKETNERTDDDIEVILEFLRHFPAFADLTLHARRELCKVFVYAHVEKAQTIVMNDGERYDSWSVIINGIIDDETLDGQLIRTLTVGQSFGCAATLDQYIHRGIMKTRVDDCQFIVVAQNDYYAILNQGEKSIRKIEENGRLVMIKEIRVDDDEQKIPREIVIKATIEKLLEILVDENHLIDDPNFVEDFLLTYRTFIDDPLVITKKLLENFHAQIESMSAEHITRVILAWVNNHYNDFESNQELNEFLEKFDEFLQNHPAEHMKTWKYLLNLACLTKASVRTITLTRSTRDDVLNFHILGGSETSTVNQGIFVSKVERNSKAYESGLRRGDQILSVNGQSFDYLTHLRALEILRSTTHLSLIVKNNLLGLNEIVHPDKSPGRKKRHDLSYYEQELRNKLNGSSPIRSSHSTMLTTSPILVDSPPTNVPTPNHAEKTKPKILTKRMGLKRAVMQKLKITKNSSELDTPGIDHGLDSSVLSTSNSNKSLNRSSSNPDLSISSISNKSNTSNNDDDTPTFVVKVYRSDQSYKYFPVLKDTTAKQLVMLAITEFNIGDQSSKTVLRYYSLCEVSVENGVIKQKRLPDQIDNLPERLAINARYYLKNNNSTDALVPDQLANELIREARVQFLQLDCLEICAQLTLRDFAIFKSIQPTEYVDHIFKIQSNYGIPHLQKFLRLPNQEMYWTITEILREPNVIQRSKIVKQFIKIAKCCKDVKNFNSMFAILSGLDHKSVQRLQATWERVPEKYKNIFEDLKSILDLSRNMSVYRNLLKNVSITPPIIPMFPVCMKDLTFIHLGNQTRDEHLVNFEKLRMIAKEIRSISNMASSPYDISNMFDSPTSHSQIFAGFGHQSTADSYGTIRRNQTSMRLSIMANAKRIYDEALMVKKVKSYLANAEVIEDEDRLLDLTNQCEPISTIKRRPSPSASSLSSNSSSDRRGDSVQLTKFGTQSPDAINKLFRLSDSSHQIKTRPISKPNSQSTTLSTVRHASPILPSTGFTSLRESSAQKISRMRDTKKLTSESSSLNLKAPPSTSSFYVRSHLIQKSNGDVESSNSDDKSRFWIDPLKLPNEESPIGSDDHEQVTAV